MIHGVTYLPHPHRSYQTLKSLKVQWLNLKTLGIGEASLRTTVQNGGSYISLLKVPHSRIPTTEKRVPSEEVQALSRQPLLMTESFNYNLQRVHFHV